MKNSINELTLNLRRAQITELQNKIDEALCLIETFGNIDGSHHKTWLIDQMVRILTGPNYDQWVKDKKDGEDGPDTYHWDCGIAP